MNTKKNIQQAEHYRRIIDEERAHIGVLREMLPKNFTCKYRTLRDMRQIINAINRAKYKYIKHLLMLEPDLEMINRALSRIYGTSPISIISSIDDIFVDDTSVTIIGNGHSVIVAKYNKVTK